MKTSSLLLLLLLFVWQDARAEGSGDDDNVVEGEEEDFDPNITGRFLVSTTTSTSTIFLTTSATCTQTTSCGAIAAGVTQCRRRRNGEEIPSILDDINPSKISEVEPTPAAVLHERTPSLSVAELLSSSVVERGVEAVDIKGIDHCFRQRQGFPTITIIWTTSVTSSTLCQASATVTKTYTFTGCYPNAATSSTCPSSG